MVFVRFRSGEGSVAERMEPHKAELAHYRIEQMVPLDDLWVHDVDIDWKNLVENYVEDYHFPMGHPGLSALMEPQYDREVLPGGTMRLSHRMRAEPLEIWSARALRQIPAGDRAPARGHASTLDLHRAVPECVLRHLSGVAGFLPADADRARAHAIRARSYGFPDDRREMRAARWLCARLNARVQAEDEVLTRSVQRGSASGAYTQGILSDKEIVLAGFQDWIRARLPVSSSPRRRARGSRRGAQFRAWRPDEHAALRSRADTTRSRDP